MLFCGEPIHAIVAVLERTFEHDRFAFFHLSLPHVVLIRDVNVFYSQLVEGRFEFFEEPLWSFLGFSLEKKERPCVLKFNCDGQVRSQFFFVG